VAAQGKKEWWDPATAARLPDAPTNTLDLHKLATRVLCVQEEKPL